MHRSTTPMTDLALVAVFAGLIGAFSLIPAVPLPGGVPITLQTLAICLTAMILGAWRGMLATALYLAVGLAGLPIFAQGRAGPGVLAGPSAGYLISFPVYALVVGFGAQWVLRRISGRWRGLALWGAGLVGSVLVVHPWGVVGLVINAGLSWRAALSIDLVFWPGDLLKTAVAAAIAVTVHRAFPRLIPRPLSANPASPEAAQEVPAR